MIVEKDYDIGTFVKTEHGIGIVEKIIPLDTNTINSLGETKKEWILYCPMVKHLGDKKPIRCNPYFVSRINISIGEGLSALSELSDYVKKDAIEGDGTVQAAVVHGLNDLASIVKSAKDLKKQST